MKNFYPEKKFRFFFQSAFGFHFHSKCILFLLNVFLVISPLYAETHSIIYNGKFHGQLTDHLVLGSRFTAPTYSLQLKNISSRSVSFEIGINSGTSGKPKTSRSLKTGFVHPGSVEDVSLSARELSGVFSINPVCRTDIEVRDCVLGSEYEIVLSSVSDLGERSHIPLSISSSNALIDPDTVTTPLAPGEKDISHPADTSFSQTIRSRFSDYLQSARTIKNSTVQVLKNYFKGSDKHYSEDSVSGRSEPVHDVTLAEASGGDQKPDPASIDLSVNKPTITENRVSSTRSHPRSHPRSDSPAFANLSSSFEVTFSNQSSNLDRATRVLTSRADVRIKNTSSKEIPLPLHLVVTTDPVSSQIQLQGASGGPGIAPYQTYFITLGGSGSTLLPQQHLDSVLTFTRPANIIFTFQASVFGEGESVEPPPVKPVADAGPNRTLVLFPGEESVSMLLDGRKSFNPGGGELEFQWSGLKNPRSGNAQTAPRPQVVLPEGTHTFSLVVKNAQGIESDPGTVTVAVTRLGEQKPPVIQVSPKEYTIRTDESVQFQVQASHPDGESVSLVASPAVANATFQSSSSGSAANGSFSFNPDSIQSGEYFITFTANTPYGLTSQESVRITVEPVNRPPLVSVGDAFSVQEGKLLSIPVQASDPDGDMLLVTATGVPENGVFIEGSRTLLFAPDYGQAGTYSVNFSASDGSLTSAPAQTQITVTEAESDGGVPSQLVLEVDEPESPNLQNATRITGRVNVSSSAPPAPRVVSSLIQGLNPATMPQGVRGFVEITGQSGGAFPTAFIEGISRASFGPGVQLHSTEVISPNSIRAEVEVLPDTAVGPRSVTVQTEQEIAVSVVAFNVTPGATTVSGTLKDPQSGAPLGNAIVSIRGTNIFVVTGADGSFNLSGVPAGAQELLVNPPNSQILSFAIEVEPNTSIDIGDIESESLVYDPSQPPSATIPSIIGRGATRTNGRIGVEDAKKVIIDTILAVGGTEAGVLDQYGNQLNPKVEGAGLISLRPEHVSYTAELMARGESVPLHEILFGISYFAEWDRGSPPTLAQLLKSLQELVDQAWADPRDPENMILISIFNQAQGVSPDAPRITGDMLISPLGRQLMVTSFLGFIQLVRDANPDRFAYIEPGYLRKAYDFLVPSAIANSPLDPPPGTDQYTTFWKNALLQWDNFPANTATTLAAPALTVALSRMVPAVSSLNLAGGRPAPGDITKGLISGSATSLISSFLVGAILEVIQPRPPLIIGARPVKIKSPIGDYEVDLVVVEISRAGGDRGAANPPGLKYAYRLWKWDVVGGQLSLVGGGMPNDTGAARSSKDPVSNVIINPVNNQLLGLVDSSPAQGHNIYKVDVVRTVGDASGADGSNNLANGLPWYLGFLPQPELRFGGGMSFNPAGALMSFMDPLVQIVNGIRLMVSPLSDNVSAFVGDRTGGAGGGDGFVLDSRKRVAYQSVRSENNIYKIDIDTFERTLFSSAGFASPHQSGLAIDLAGNLYSENSASDDRFGGRIFRYTGAFPLIPLNTPPGVRQHAGMTNYYSFQLGYARPTSVPAMTHSLDGELFVADAIERRIKKVPVNLLYDATRRVGQPYAESELFQFNSSTDMITGNDNSLYVNLPTNILYINSQSKDVVKLFPDSSGLFQSIKSLAVDRSGALIVGDRGGASGSIMYIPPGDQSPDKEYTDCDREKYTVLSGIKNLAFVRIDDADSVLFYLADGALKRHSLGVSGTVLDPEGNPLPAAEVTVLRNGVMKGKPVVTSGCGVYRIPGLQSGSSRSTVARVIVKHPQYGTQAFEFYYPLFGHLFRDIVLRNIQPPPEPEEEPAETPEPPLEVPEPPDPVQVTVSPGKVVYAPPIKVTTVQIPARETDDSEPPPAPPAETPVEQPPIILSPVDGMQLSFEDGIAEIEVRIGSSDGDKLIGASAYANGEDISFSAAPELEVVGHEAVHTVQIGAGDASEPITVTVCSASTGSSPGVCSTSVARAEDALRNANTRGVSLEEGSNATVEANSGAVTGKVVDSSDDVPLTGVDVVIQETGARAFTDNNGVYQFPEVPPGNVTIAAEPAHTVQSGGGD
jgi:hypothetical protein